MSQALLSQINCHVTPCRASQRGASSLPVVSSSMGMLKSRQVPLQRSFNLTARKMSTRQAPVRFGAVASTDLGPLKEKFDIKGFVEVKEGNGGLPCVKLSSSTGSTAEIYLFGGLLLSWKLPAGDEVFYTRPDAVFDKSKPVSGGVPHCFPQFGPGPMQQHGFARNLDWTITSTSADLQPDERDPEVEITLTESEYTLKMWPYKFRAVFSVSLHGDTLNTDLRIINMDDKPFDFTAALHTYIEVLDVNVAKVKGLKGKTYLDKVVDSNNPPSKVEDREFVNFAGPVDSVYVGADPYVELDVGTGAAVAISSSGWEDVVVWSPWTAMEACYKNFVCVENAKFSSPAVVKPGESWRAGQSFSVIDIEAPSA